MKCGEHAENISGPISVTDISKFTGRVNEESLVSGPVCGSNRATGSGVEELHWRFERRQIPRATTEEGDHSGWIVVIYAYQRKQNLALQRFRNEQAKEGDFTCFYKPTTGRTEFVSISIYFPSE